MRKRSEEIDAETLGKAPRIKTVELPQALAERSMGATIKVSRPPTAKASPWRPPFPGSF